MKVVYIQPGSIQAVLGIGILFLGTLIFACQILSLNKTKTTSKYYSIFLIMSVTQYEHDNEKIKNIKYIACLDSIIII